MGFSKWRIRLNRTPTQESAPVDHVPVFIWNVSVLVSHPAYIPVFEQSGIGKDERVGLVGAEFFDDAREIVDVASTATSIQPNFNHIPLVLAQSLSIVP